MNDPLRAIAELHGVFLRREALAMGCDDTQLRHSVLAGVLKRVRHGCYCFADQWPERPEDQHLVRAKAVLRVTPGPVAFSHTTSLILQGVDVWGADLSRVHVTRLDQGAGRRLRDVTHHVGAVPETELTEVGGLLVTNTARAVLEAASVLNIEKGLVVADSALHKELCTADEVLHRFDEINHWPGSRRLQIVVRMMDGLRESPGETRSAYLFWMYGLPKPVYQWEVHDEHGQLVGTTDFAWVEQKVMGEFDGKVKYGRLLKPGQSPSEVVFAEKQREDRLRELTGFTMRRMVWSDLDHPVVTARRLAAALRIPMRSRLLGA